MKRINIKNSIKIIHPVDGIILTICFIGLFAFFVFFYRKSEYVQITVKVTDQDVLYANTNPYNWYANRFVVGDKELDTVGNTLSEITHIETINTNSNKKALYVRLRVKSLYDSQTKTHSVKGKRLGFGTPLRFNISSIAFNGIVTEFPGSEAFAASVKTETKIITTLLRAYNISANQTIIEPAVLESIRVGNKMTNSNNVVLAEVLDIQLKPAKRSVSDRNGELFVRLDPLYKDAVITLRVQTKTYQEEAYVLDDVPLKIGEELPLHFPHVSILPTIIRIEDELVKQ